MPHLATEPSEDSRCARGERVDRVMWLGFLELACLSALAILAAIAVGLRIRWNGRVELFVGASIVVHALVTGLTLVLGWFNVLYRSTLGLTCALVSLAVLAL